MGRRLIIAEKPNLGQNIISAIGRTKFKREDGYAESEEYIVTWAFGHLFELLDLEDYKAGSYDNKTGWTMEGLPFCPAEFRYGLRKDPKTKTIDRGVKKQYQLIKSLLERKDVTDVIHAGDADREGEIIIRIILQMANNRKPVYRLWIPAQTAEDINEGLRRLEPDQKYDRLAQEGYARSYVDWLFGINLTRAATIHSGTLLRVGRVIVPIVKAIYDRDMEIQNFQSTPYLIVASEAETQGQKLRLVCKEQFSSDHRAAAQSLADHLNSQAAVVDQVNKEEKTIPPGKLLNQSKLQALAGKKYKLSPKETLDIAQRLYEAGYTTYPRTSSEYLASSERDKTNRILDRLKAQGYHVVSKDLEKTIYDDSKIESHSAITPTGKFPEPGTLSSREQQIYDLIFFRFLAVFYSLPCTVERTTMVIRAGDQRFTLKGDVCIQEGWRQYDGSNRSEKDLPQLDVGDLVNVHFQVEERQTKPPAHYTVETLGNHLRNPFRKEQACVTTEDLSETSSDDNSLVYFQSDSDIDHDDDYQAILAGLEIGTEATRAGIIDRAIRSGYISLKNNQYQILPGGIYYIEALWKMGITIDKTQTANLGRMLKRVYHGELGVKDVTDYSMREIFSYFERAFSANVSPRPKEADPYHICSCPLCGGSVREGKKSYYCSNYKRCSLNGLWKNACYVNIKPKDIVALLNGKTISKSYKTRTGSRATKKLRYDLSAGKIMDVSGDQTKNSTQKRGGTGRAAKK